MSSEPAGFVSTTQDLQGQGGRASFITGDVFDVLATIEDGSVDLVLTSPPFLALRSYLPADHPDKHREIGAEPDPASFLATLLGLTAEFRRILAPHGSICVELGDTYSGSGGAGGDYGDGGIREGQGKFDGSGRRDRAADVSAGILQPRKRGGAKARDEIPGWPLAKSLCGIPHLYHLSLAYGRNLLTGEPCEPWRVRNVVAWCRPNPPVGALGDKFRPATSYLTIACPSGQRYFDLDAVRTEAHQPDKAGDTSDSSGRNGAPGHYGAHPAGAPPLDWWNVSTEPYSGSHYATWPRKLLDRPIKAMCPMQVCTTCGEPTRRITARTEDYARARAAIGNFNQRPDESGAVSGSRSVISKAAGRDITCAENVTTGWTDCGHNTWRPGIVLDPFGGSGTTLAVATGRGHHAIGIDLDPRNVDLARDRVGPMFLDEFTLDEWKNRSEVPS